MHFDIKRELYGFDAKKVKDDLVTWIRDWFARNGKDCSAVIGISGGKDSTIAAALCVEALGRERVIGVRMPCGTQADIADATLVCNYLSIPGIEMNIEGPYNCIKFQYCNAVDYKAELSEQALINLPPRLRMATLFAVAQTNNGRVIGTCNLSEDWVGYSTYGGDAFASVMPLANLTSDEVIAVGYELGLPKELLEKTPADGLCGKTDEDNLGFTYATLNKYIRTGVCDDEDVKAKIDRLHVQNLFKLRMPDSFRYLTDDDMAIAKRMV